MRWEGSADEIAAWFALTILGYTSGPKSAGVECTVCLIVGAFVLKARKLEPFR